MQSKEGITSSQGKESNASSIVSQSQFPISGAEAAKVYHQYLTPFERDEIRSFDVVYYMNLTANRKA
jgi:glutamate mutase epsilon subunit